MAPLVVLLTSPRMPPGQLTGAAWKALLEADQVGARDDSSATACALEADGVSVHAIPDATARSLLTQAADRRLVWVAGDDGDESLLTDLADDIVTRAQTGTAPADVEILVASFDPRGARLLDLVNVVDRLRRECPWDRAQTSSSLVRYLVEEAYETVEAIESGSRQHLQEELGDLLLQVVLHSRIAAEDPDGPFDIDDVAGGIVEKMIRRHPHVFGGAEASDADEVQSRWQEIKAAEKERASALDGIPPGLPALALADKVIARTLPSPAPADPTYTTESLGEALFALTAAARSAGLDAEQALRARVRREIADVRGREQRATQVDPDDPG